ncbi:hypothetical protein ABIE45_001265 [Methylobacterium sp. OAE515]
MRLLAIVVLLLFAGAYGGLAQVSSGSPVRRDSIQGDPTDQSVEFRLPSAVAPNRTDGVVGFDGPPPSVSGDVIGRGVLPPGSPADSDDY